jgi:hypothetical protein
MNSDSHQPVVVRRRTVAVIAVGIGLATVAGLNSMSSAAPTGDEAASISIPDGPLLPTVPQATLILQPDDPSTDVTTTIDTETTEPTTTTTTESTDASAVTTVATQSNDPSQQPGILQQLELRINAATVRCEGVIEIGYDTTATPDTGLLANHLVIVNPVSNPASFATQEVIGQPANGTFVFETPGNAGETYRAFVIALFDPTVATGAKLIEQVDVLPAADCG